MGGSSSQVVGYRYYAKFAAFIGNRIEKFLAINFDNRGWIVKDKDDDSSSLTINKPSLYGENEGGVAGIVDIHPGLPDAEPNAEYQKYFPLVSGYPYQSYLVFHGLGGVKTDGGLVGGLIGSLQAHRHNSFYLGNSGYMKEMLLWVKRTRVRNDGRVQWYEIRGDGTVVCEIGARIRRFAEVSTEDVEPSNISIVYRRESTTGETIGELTPIFCYIGYDDQWRFSERVYSGSYVVGGNNVFTKEEVTVKRKPWPICIFEVTLSSIGYTDHFFIGDIIKVRKLSEETIDQITVNDFSLIQKFEVTVLLNKDFSIVLEASNPEIRDSNFAVRANIAVNLIRFLDGADAEKDALDLNPIHKIREILTDDTAMGKPESDVNDANFIKAADRIYDEGLGISWAIDEKSCIEAIEELCYHIESGIRVNRQTGLYEMVLFRDDWFADDEIHDIAENKIKDLSLEVMNSDDIVNQLNVTYYDRERIKNSTFSVYENGSILTMGHANAESVEFPYFMNMRNAEIVANWKLKQYSTPIWSGSFTTGWREARKWNRYDLIRLPWSKKWNGTILARIMKINLGNGTDNTVTIDFEEVIPYSGDMNTSVVVDESMNKGVLPPQPAKHAVFEAPYYLTVLRAGQTNTDLELSNNPDIGYIAAIAAKPQSNSLNALLYTDGGAAEFEQVSRLDYCDILQLDQLITEITSSFVVTGSLTQTTNSNNLILLNDELMGFVGFDDETKILTVKRGVLDTVPKKHNNGSLFVFDLPDVAFDSTQYAQSEIVEAQVLTTTPSGVQELLGNGQAIEIQSRAIRPYPPANVKINGEYWSETHVVSNDLVLTWSHRNRIQQTAATHVDWYDSSVTIEDGVTYSLELSTVDSILLTETDINADIFTIDANMFIPNKAHKLKLWSERDGFDSYAIFEHNFFVEALSLILTATATSGGVSGNTVPTANISIDVDTSFKANMQFDGSGIKGKTLPNSIITIEVE